MPPMTIGQAVRRTRGPLSQTALADAAGTYQSAISDLEHGRQALTVEAMIELEQAAGRPPGFLLRQLGYLDADQVTDLILSDPELDDDQRIALRAVRDTFITEARRRSRRTGRGS